MRECLASQSQWRALTVDLKKQPADPIEGFHTVCEYHTTSPRSHLLSLPNELLAHICEFVHQDEAASLLHSCRRLRAVVRTTRADWFVTDSCATSFRSLFRLTQLFPCLSRLTIDGYHMLTDEELNALQGLKQLRHLRIARCHQINASALAGVSTLTSLDIESCFRVSDCSTASMVKPRLQWLRLSNLLHLNGFGFPYLVAMAETLVHLDLTGCHRVCDTNMHNIAVLQNIRILLLDNLYRLTDDAIPHIVSLQHLHTLGLGGCRHLSGTGLLLLRNCPSLLQLNLAGCARVTLEAVSELHSVRPGLRVAVPEAVCAKEWWKTL